MKYWELQRSPFFRLEMQIEFSLTLTAATEKYRHLNEFNKGTL